MALSIKTDEADRLARELARLTGETLTDSITKALRERLERERAARQAEGDLPPLSIVCRTVSLCPAFLRTDLRPLRTSGNQHQKTFIL